MRRAVPNRLTNEEKFLPDHNEAEISPATSGRKTRVVFVSISFHPEPGAVMGLPLAKKLQASGKYDVSVLTAIPWYPLGHRYPGYKLRAWQWEVIDGIRILRVPLYASHDASFVRRVFTYLSFAISAIVFGLPKIKRADVVFYFDNLPTTGFVVFLLQAFSGAATIQHIGDLWPDTVLESGMLPAGMTGLARKIIGGWCAFLYRRHQAITVASPGLRKLLMDRGVPASKVSVVYTWAFEEIFFPASPSPDAVTQMHSRSRFTVLYAGNLGPLQALDTMLEAAAILRSQTDIQFVLIGTGQSERQLRARAAELRLENVSFLGPRSLDEMNAYNATADALLVHLKDIGLMRSMTPSKTQVAMACARPILMGVAGDGALVVERAGAGISFEPQNPRAMADAILQLKNLDPERRRAMGQAGRRYYDSEMSFDIGAQRMVELFQQASQSNKKRSLRELK